MTITRILNARSVSSSSIRSAAGRAYVYDADAETYIAAVEAADGQRLEWGVRQAIAQFVVGCKTDNIWSAIKASCILCGARTLSGALTALAGSNPTNSNFVTGDYSRTLGLVGNGTNKYLDSGRSSTADGQNDAHIAVWQTTAASSGSDVFMTHIGAVQTTPSIVASQIAEGFVGSNNIKVRRLRDSAAVETKSLINNANGLQGLSRSASGSFTYRVLSTSTSITATSASGTSYNYHVFAQTTDGTIGNYSNARLAFYSIGSSLNLSLLDTRVARLFHGIGAALG